AARRADTCARACVRCSNGSPRPRVPTCCRSPTIWTRRSRESSGKRKDESRKSDAAPVVIEGSFDFPLSAFYFPLRERSTEMGLLDGKVAIVTGAGRGLGREEALALAGEGAGLIVTA